MKMFFLFPLFTGAVALLGCQASQKDSSLRNQRHPASATESAMESVANDRKAASLATPQAWLDHLERDLLPYWMHPDAFGKPVGMFPTFRCNDGSLYDPSSNACPELANAEPWIKSELKRNYTRMISRQVYFYSVAYHMTGDEQLLKYAKDGVDFLRNRAIDHQSGAVISYWEDGQADSKVELRSSQDTAYALMGLAMYYYITRDQATLRDILTVKNYIFTHYFDPNFYAENLGLMKWDLTQNKPDQPVVQDLTANLDQLNGYMMLLEPLLTGKEGELWHKNIAQLIETIKNKFYDPGSQMFWGQLHDPTTKYLGWGHTDFGHTVKTYWMMLIAAERNHDESLANYARNGIKNTLKSAYLGADESGHPLGWASRPHLYSGFPAQKDANPVNCPEAITRPLNCEQEWWVLAELDQAASTLAMNDPSVHSMLDNGAQYWFEEMVDQKNHEIWHMLGSPRGTPKFPKIHLWKNGFHSAEHALVGYITSAGREKKSVTLYFATSPTTDKFVPYFFRGKVESRTTLGPLKTNKRLSKIRVIFGDIH